MTIPVIIGIAVLVIFVYVLATGGSSSSAAEDCEGREPDVVLILDASGSMESDDYPPDRKTAAKNSARAFVQRVAEDKPGARIAIVAFGSNAQLCCNLTPVTKPTPILAAIERIENLGGTNMHAALNLAYQTLRRSDRPKQVIFLTDGLNNKANPEGIAEKLRAIATVNCVGIGDREEIDERLLKRIASPYPDGRPRYRWIGDPEELEEHFRELAGHISRE